jgi:hypothetical protein
LTWASFFDAECQTGASICITTYPARPQNCQTSNYFLELKALAYDDTEARLSRCDEQQIRQDTAPWPTQSGHTGQAKARGWLKK